MYSSHIVADAVISRRIRTRHPIQVRMQLVGPFAAGTADTEAVNTRYCMFIPNPYLTMLLDDCLTPHEAWMQLQGAMVADGKVAVCQPLIDWHLSNALSVMMQDLGEEGNPWIHITPKYLYTYEACFDDGNSTRVGYTTT